MNNYLIAYSGLSLKTCPRVDLLRQSIAGDGGKSRVIAFCRKPGPNLPGTHVLAFGDARGLAKATAFLITLARFTLKLVRFFMTDRPNIVYAINPIAGFCATVFLPKCKLVYESQEIFLDMAGRNSKGVRCAVWYWMEWAIFRRADLIVFPDQYRLRFAQLAFHLGRHVRCTHAFNCPSSEEISQAECEQPSIRLPDWVGPILSYCGGVEEGRSIPEIIQAFALCREQHPSARLVLAGNVSDGFRSQLEEMIGRLHLRESVVFTGGLPGLELKKIMARSTTTLILYDQDNLNNRLCSPNKVFDAINLGVGCIMSKSPLGRSLARIFPSVRILERLDVPNLAEAMVEACSTVGVKGPSIPVPTDYRWEGQWARISRCFPPGAGE